MSTPISPGARRAAEALYAGRVHQGYIQPCAEIIERETRCGELAEALDKATRRIEYYAGADGDELVLRARRLLAEVRS